MDFSKSPFHFSHEIQILSKHKQPYKTFKIKWFETGKILIYIRNYLMSISPWVDRDVKWMSLQTSHLTTVACCTRDHQWPEGSFVWPGIVGFNTQVYNDVHWTALLFQNLSWSTPASGIPWAFCTRAWSTSLAETKKMRSLAWARSTTPSSSTRKLVQRSMCCLRTWHTKNTLYGAWIATCNEEEEKTQWGTASLQKQNSIGLAVVVCRGRG